MKYNFDEAIDRRGTSSVKVDGVKNVWGRDDLMPMWVADMDFATPPFIIDAVRKRCEHPVLGYTEKPDSYYEAILNWVNPRYNMNAERKHINFVPGIVAGLGMALNCFTSPGDKVMIMPPVYGPFAWLNRLNDRNLVECPLKLIDGVYHIDVELFHKLRKGIRVLILCNPHNPGGVVWTHEELEMIADICADDNIIIFSDEIHADLTLPPHKHVPFATVNDKARYHSITFMAPSKTFNMPGVAASHTFIFNDMIREKFEKYLAANELNAGHVFVYPAVEAAYNEGSEWLEQCLEYIQQNIEYVDRYMKTNMPKIKVMIPQASFLLWLDCKELGMEQAELADFFADGAHLALNDGTMFGEEGRGYMRMNIGCPRATVEQAMKQLKAAYDTRF